MKSSMAKNKDIGGGFYNNDTIYSPNGYTQARRVSNAIIDRNISDMQNEIQQGENPHRHHKIRNRYKFLLDGDIHGRNIYL